MAGSFRYRVRVRVQGELSPGWWATVFSGLVVAPEPDGTTLLQGALADDAALYGLLASIRDLGIPLLSVETAAESDRA